MSEDDRAAKAARAKALLKKRQQKKAGAGAASDLASPPPSRPFTPASPEGVEERHVGDLFSAHDANDTSWISSLPKAQVTPHHLGKTTSLPSGNVQSPPTLKATSRSHPPPEEKEKEKDALEKYAEAQSQYTETLSLLEARISSLTAELDQSQKDKTTILSNQQQTVELLVSEKAGLAGEMERLGGEAEEMRKLLEAERVRAVELQERLEGAVGEVRGVEGENEVLRGRERELGEKTRELERMLQVSSATCSNLQKEVEVAKRRFRELEEQVQGDDRVERLESTLKNTQDRGADLELQLSRAKQAYVSLKEVNAELVKHREGEEAWRAKYASLEEEHEGVKGVLKGVEGENAKLGEEKRELERRVEALESEVNVLQDRLNEGAVELAGHARQLQSAVSELKAAKRRAEEAERLQGELQSEGTALMRSLEEMRPKIVELTGVRVELGERVSGLEGAVRERDGVIARLEGEVDELRAGKEEAEGVLEERVARERAEGGEVRRAQKELEEELDAAHVTIRKMEVERSAQHREAGRSLAELERLERAGAEQAEIIRALQEEAEEYVEMRREEEEYLVQAQSEIEGLRQAVESRDEEIERLRVGGEEYSGPASLDEEMLSSLRQQHALAMSAAQSRIRALESAVFDAEARVHELEVRRASSPVYSPPVSPLPARSRAIDAGLSVETRHKRKVSLSMLKARIEREGGVSVASTPIVQFLDDSHVLWCACCRGDLVIL